MRKIVFSEQSKEKLKPSFLVLLVLPLQAGSLSHGVREKQTTSFKLMCYTDNCMTQKTSNCTLAREAKVAQAPKLPLQTAVRMESKNRAAPIKASELSGSQCICAALIREGQQLFCSALNKFASYAYILTKLL